MHASTFIYHHQQRQHRRKFPSSEARGESRFFTTLQRSRPCINASYCLSPLIKKKKDYRQAAERADRQQHQQHR